MTKSGDIEQYKKRLSIALKAAGICVFEVDLLHQEYVFFENAEDIFGISGEVILREIEPYVLIDIDNFKLINDAYGHTVGDEIIQCVAHNLKNAFADSLIGRFGGDEFTVLVQNISHRDKLPEPRFYDRILMG